MASSFRRTSTIHGGEYLVLVRATDHAPQPRSASLPVRITVTMSVDTPPSWSLSSNNVIHHSKHLPRSQVRSVIEVSEWASRGSIIASAAATAPKTSLHYQISGGNSANGDDEQEGMFAITSSSGVLSLAAQLDREKCSWYNLTISATNLVSTVYLLRS